MLFLMPTDSVEALMANQSAVSELVKMNTILARVPVAIYVAQKQLNFMKL